MNSYKAQDFIDAIPGSGGIISTIARKVGCVWHTAKKYINQHQTVLDAYNAECERVLDRAEAVIIEDIVTNKDTATAKWYLTMKGRERGYAQTTRNEVTGKDGGGLNIVIKPREGD